MDFGTDALFGSETQTLPNRTRRELSSCNRKQVTAYTRRKHDFVTNATRSKGCSASRTQATHRHMFAEHLDHDLLDASFNAEKDLPKFLEPARSVELVQARKKSSYWQNN